MYIWLVVGSGHFEYDADSIWVVKAFSEESKAKKFAKEVAKNSREMLHLYKRKVKGITSNYINNAYIEAHDKLCKEIDNQIIDKNYTYGVNFDSVDYFVNKVELVD